MKITNAKQIFFSAVAVITVTSTFCKAMRIHAPENALLQTQAGTAVTQRTITCPGKNSSTTTWVHPSEIAKDCLDALGKSLVTKCQNTADNAYDPSKTNSSISTVWETCCSLYAELDCYLEDGKSICPAATYKKLANYTTEVVVFFQASLCHTVIDIGWKDYCTAMMHNSSHARHPSPPVDPNQGKHLVDLPPRNGPEKMCFSQMETFSGGNLVNKCMNDTLNIWDPYRNKTINADMQDGCCAFNSVMNCLASEAKKTCNQTNLPALLNYQSRSLKKMSTILCKKVPIIVNGNKFCNNIHNDPNLTGGALTASVSSIVALFIILFGFSTFMQQSVSV